MRDFRCPDDGHRWQVWAVQPAGFFGPATVVTGREATERRRHERRMTPVETLDDPPVLQRRRGHERRTIGADEAAPARPSPIDLLPAQWRDGWLVFERVDDADDADTRETRRLAPIPACWDECSEAELIEYLRQAARRARTAKRA